MKCKIEQLAEGLMAIKPKHWWNDPISKKDLVVALASLSVFSRIVSVCRMGGFFSSTEYLVVVEKK